MKLSRNGQIVLSALFVASLVLGGAIKGNKIDVFVENPKMEKQVTEVYLKRRN